MTAHPHNPIRIPRGFTLVELLVVVAIIALLLAILLPALGKARAVANTVACMSNERQIALATTMYASEHNGFYPQIDKIDRTALEDYGIARGQSGGEGPVWTCPDAGEHDVVTDETPITYTFSKVGLLWIDHKKVGEIADPSRGMIFADGRMNQPWGAWIFIDGHSVLSGYETTWQTRQTFYSASHNLSDSAYVGAADMDGAGAPSGVRYRHLDDTQTAAVFFDGHAEMFAIDELTKGAFVTGW